MSKKLESVILLALMPVSGVSAQTLQPDGAWQVNYAENECQLLRTFGKGDEAVTWRLARGASLDTYDMMIAGQKLPSFKKSTKINIALKPSGSVATVNAQPYWLPKHKLRVLRWFDLDQKFIDNFDDTQALSFEMGTNAVTVAPKGIKKALVALKGCHDDLLTNVFKLDVAALRSLKSTPVPAANIIYWVTTDDYPRQSLLLGQQGITQFILMVGEDGKPVKCTTVVSSGFPVLDQTACQKMMERAKFEPARDKDGKAVSAPWLRSVRWTIPT